MKASGLRIGNWVNIGVNIAEIKGIHTQTIGTDDDRGQHLYVKNYPNSKSKYFPVDPEDISPIPLTEEWLVRFGLINSNGFFKWHRSAIYKGNEKWIYGILGDDNNSYYHVSELQYVHQLQNLYFALTGEELTIK